MAAAAKCTIAQVREVVELGALDPEAIVTPGIYVQRVVPAQLVTRVERSAVA
jgi:3-oxoadipate CoA-transferase alpha subunit